MKLGKQLFLYSIGLLALPWLGYHYLTDLSQFLIKGQERSQLLAAQAVATSLQNRNDLFELEQDLPQSFEENALYVYPLPYFIQIDGYHADWEDVAKNAGHFGAENIIRSEGQYDPRQFSFDLVLGQRESYLYILLQVTDSSIIYRHPRFNRLDNSDHIRIATMDDNEKTHRYILTTEGLGFISAYEVGKYWKYPVTGRPVPGILGFWRQSTKGYNVELRIPLSLIGKQGRFDVAVANIDDPKKRQVKMIIGTLPTKWSKELNHIVYRTPELERIVTGLKRPGISIWVVDRFSRVRAHVADNIHADRETQTRTENAIQQALMGLPATQRFKKGGQSGPEVIMAAFPIRSKNEVLGAVIVELPTDEILALQKKTLEQSAIYTAIVIVLIVAGLLFFSWRLTFRIQSLRQEVSQAVDINGRVLTGQLSKYAHSKDEIGDLSRSISSILLRLESYTQFLERMPRTLKHEINNPLNTISTSIQNLALSESPDDQQRCLDSAERGICKLTKIVQSLADAASLEESLRHEDINPVNLTAVMLDYVENCQRVQTEHPFKLHHEKVPVMIQGNDFRLEQMLDKLVDNAVEFSPVNSAILFNLESDSRFAWISIANQGPLLPKTIRKPLFESMVTHRTQGARNNSNHLGIGLYIVRIIAEYHAAEVRAENREDTPGVKITVKFPRYDDTIKKPQPFAGIGG